MNILKSFTVLAAGIITLGISVVHAGIISGSYTNDFMGGIKLWDVSGTYDESSYYEGVDLSVGYTVNMGDPSGKFTGTGTFSFDDNYGDVLDGNINASGTIKSAGSVVRVQQTFQVTGTGTVEGYDVTFTAVMNQKLELDSSTSSLIGSTSDKITVTVPSLGRNASVSLPTSYIETALPENVTGDWSLIVNGIPVGAKYSGTATVVLSTGASSDFPVTGTYSAKTDLSKIIMKGISSSLNLGACCTDTNLNILNLKGKMYGQSIKTP